MTTQTIREQRWGHYAALTALATLGLIALGGLVTSHGAGMAVPDWPTTYGYNMFLFPVSQWVGGIFYEHTHRLYASVVGLMTVVLTLGLHVSRAPRLVVRLGWAALFLVVVQGVLGGLRVTLMKDMIGVLHASLAQAFLVLLVLIALFLSRGWWRWREGGVRVTSGLRTLMMGVTLLIFLQLILGASMRHQHAGLAVPDFPLAYGRIWPPTDDAFLQGVNAARVDTRDFHPILPFHVYLHMAHRGLGLLLAGLVAWAAWRLRREAGPGSGPGKLAVLWVGLIGVQVLLGAITVWSNKAADMATAHVVVGALCLAVGAMGTALAWVAGERGVAATGVSASRSTVLSGDWGAGVPTTNQ